MPDISVVADVREFIRVRRPLMAIAVVVLGLTACRSEPRDTEVLPGNSTLEFDPTARVDRSATTDAIERVQAANLSAVIERDNDYDADRTERRYDRMALAFLDRYRDEFRLQDPSTNLATVRVQTDKLGFHQVRLKQSYKGLRVLDAELLVHFDRQDHIYLVNGHYLPTSIAVSTKPALSAQAAKERLAKESDSGFDVGPAELVVLLAPLAGRLAYRFEANRSLTDRREIIVDADSGATLRNAPLVLNSH